MDNAIVTEPYSKEDVCSIPSVADVTVHGKEKGFVMDKNWQRGYLKELTELVLKIADESGEGGVPEYLKEHRPAKFAAKTILELTE